MSAGGTARLAGLDGVRGLAALFVLLHHVYLRSFPGYPGTTGPWWTSGLVYGHVAVVVFIVVSGFSLAVSPARDGWELGSLARFAHRRAWRILPPYWAALIFSLLVAWLIIPQPGVPVPTAGSVVVNGLLLQDAIDAPTPNRAFWSIAVEVHLYLVFPLLLLMIRRSGATAMLAVVSVAVVSVGVLAPYAAGPAWLMRLTPQFAVLFAIGVVAAGIVTVDERRRRWPWHWLAFVAAVPVVAVTAWRGSAWALGPNVFWVDLALGPAIGCLLAALATRQPESLARALDTPALRRLGLMSYSLYLTHAPIVVVMNEFLIAGRFRQGVPSFLVSVAVIVPVCLAFAWWFASVFETPFLRHRGWSALRDTLPGRRLATPARRHEHHA